VKGKQYVVHRSVWISGSGCSLHPQNNLMGAFITLLKVYLIIKLMAVILPLLIFFDLFKEFFAAALGFR